LRGYVWTSLLHLSETARKEQLPNCELVPNDWTLERAHEAFIANTKGLGLTLLNEEVVLRGTTIYVHTFQFLNPEVYKLSDQIDGYRYVNLRQAGGERTISSSAVSTQAQTTSSLAWVYSSVLVASSQLQRLRLRLPSFFLIAM
jgi:hypothetical protein